MAGPTASGEIYDMNRISAAHKQLPLGTVVQVKNRDNGKKLRVPINDRGPFIKGRIIDLSVGAARKLDMFGQGLANVRIKVVRVAPKKRKLPISYPARSRAGGTSRDRRAAAAERTARGSFTIQAGAFRKTQQRPWRWPGASRRELDPRQREGHKRRRRPPRPDRAQAPASGRRRAQAPQGRRHRRVPHGLTTSSRRPGLRGSTTRCLGASDAPDITETDNEPERAEWSERHPLQNSESAHATWRLTP